MSAVAHILKLKGVLTLCGVPWQDLKPRNEYAFLLGRAYATNCDECRRLAQDIPEAIWEKKLSHE